MVRHPHVSRCKALAALVDLGVPETRLMGQIWVIQEVTCARRSSHWLASSLFAMLKTIAIIGVSPIEPVWNHMVRKRRSKRKKIFLLPLGGGVFNNPFTGEMALEEKTEWFHGSFDWIYADENWDCNRMWQLNGNNQMLGETHDLCV